MFKNQVKKLVVMLCIGVTFSTIAGEYKRKDDEQPSRLRRIAWWITKKATLAGITAYSLQVSAHLSAQMWHQIKNDVVSGKALSSPRDFAHDSALGFGKTLIPGALTCVLGYLLFS